MSKKPTYFDLLKDPRWQRKSAEIKQRDDYQCLDCEADDKTLTVHHCIYEWGKNPWEYDDSTLKTLCTGCHQSRSKLEKSIRQIMAVLPTEAVEQIHGYVLGQYIQSGLTDLPGEAYVWMESIFGLKDSTPHCDLDDVIGSTKDSMMDISKLRLILSQKRSTRNNPE